VCVCGCVRVPCWLAEELQGCSSSIYVGFATTMT